MMIIYSFCKHFHSLFLFFLKSFLSYRFIHSQNQNPVVPFKPRLETISGLVCSRGLQQDEEEVGCFERQHNNSGGHTLDQLCPHALNALLLFEVQNDN